MSRILVTLIVIVGIWSYVKDQPGRAARANDKGELEKKDTLPQSTRIALVDMARIFKTSKFFEKERDALKLKISDSEDVARKMTVEYQQLAERYKGLDQFSEERKELESRLKTKAAEFEEFRKSMSQSFLKEESVIYLKTYRMVSKEIANHAQAHGIDLVMRTNAEELPEDNPKELLQGMNRQVIYENKLDITDEIIAALSEQLP